MELHKICSPILKQESRKSAHAATTTKQISPFWGRLVMILNRLQIVQSSVFHQKRQNSCFLNCGVSSVTASSRRRFLQLFSLHHQLFRTRGGGLGSFVSCSFQAFLKHHIAVGSLAGASPERRPKVWGNQSWSDSFHHVFWGAGVSGWWERWRGFRFASLQM